MNLQHLDIRIAFDKWGHFNYFNDQNVQFIPRGICIYFMQTPVFYLFCRKSLNETNEKSRREQMDISTLENSLILMGMINSSISDHSLRNHLLNIHIHIEIYTYKQTLQRHYRAFLSQLRSGHCPKQQSYLHSINADLID